MESCYPVYWKGEKAGQLTVEKAGLYYCFLCRVKLPAGSRCRLYAHTNGESRDLGLCVPDGGDFVLQRKLPIKQFSHGEYSFLLDQPAAEQFVPVWGDRPFPAMDNLEKGKFAVRRNQPGILFPAAQE